MCFGHSKKGKRKKNLDTGRQSESERRREFKLHTQEGQDFSVTATASHLNTHKSSESRSVDLTNNGIGKHYLRDVDHGAQTTRIHVSFNSPHRKITNSNNYQVCRDFYRTQSQWECICSSVTKVAEFILLQVSRGLTFGFKKSNVQFKYIVDARTLQNFFFYLEKVM